MKKTIQLVAACSMLAFSINAQTTGQSLYGHAAVPAILTSGTYAAISPGFVMAGDRPSVAVGSPNLYIDKTNTNGQFLSAASDFRRSYRILTGGTSCGSTLSQETSCFGVSVVETNQGSTRYATASSYASGVMVMFLKLDGALASNMFYPFPAGTSSPSKPVIAASTVNPGKYYVCCSAVQTATGTRFMYVFKIDVNCNPFWSRRYTIGTANGTFIRPSACVEDSYTGTELAIVGTLRNGGTEDAFLLTLDDATNGNVNSLFTYGSTADDGFSSLKLAASNGGYIAGGVTNITTSGRAWMTRLNASGSVDWSSRVLSTTNNSAGDVVGIAERFSSAYSQYEYYGVTTSGSGMIVSKLDNAGNIFSQAGNTNSEFVYNDGSGNMAVPAAISVWDGTPSDPNSGIHVFGTNVSGPGNYFLVQACNNGASGSCASPSRQNLTTINSVFTGPNSTTAPSITAGTGLTQCTNSTIIMTVLGYAPVQNGYVTGSLPVAPYVGDNSRPAAPVGLSEVNMEQAGALAVYPNPVSNTAQISYNTGNGGEVKVDLYNALGQFVATLDKGHKDAGVNTITADLSNMDLQTGVYLVNVTVNGTTTQQKIVFQKD